MIDPNMFVQPPFLPCPECGERGFGVLSIGSELITRRCTSCQFKGRRALPSVTKKLVFLDQFAFSNMVRVAHPELHRAGPHSEFYRRLMIALDRLVHLQAVVCPEVSTHEEESALDRRIEKPVSEAIRHFSGRVRLVHRKSLEIMQTVGTATAWHEGQEFKFEQQHVRRVVLGNPHSWLPALDIVVNTLWSDEEVDVLRSIRRGTIRDWEAVFERWRQIPLSVMDRFREEAKGYGRSVLSLSARRSQSIIEMRAGQRPVDPAEIDSRRFEPARCVVAALVAGGLSVEDAEKRTMEFFLSDAVLDIPFNRLSSMLYASLSKEIQDGRKGPTDHDLGTPADFATISTSLPYCDAMFVDNKCAHYLSQGPLAAEVKKHGCRVFSLKTREEFLRYLAELEAVVPGEQRELAEEIYGTLPTDVPALFPADAKDESDEASAT